MTLRIKCAAEFALKLNKPFSADDRKQLAKLALGIARTSSMMKFYRLHMDTLAEIDKLRDQIDTRGAS